jgi:hypothetical protein
MEKTLESFSQEKVTSLRASMAFLFKITLSSATYKFNAL